MKRTLLTGLFVAATVMFVHADGVISDAMKKYHKGDTSTTKKISGGTATPEEIADVLKTYEVMAEAKPPRGEKASWDAKTKAVIDALKGLQKDPKATKPFEEAVSCKACHTEHKKK